MRDKTFRNMLIYLRRKYELISLEHLISGKYPNSGKPLCLLTFDDGWQDNYTTAREILLEFGVRPLIFVATGLIDSGGTFWEESLLNSLRSGTASDLVPRLLSELQQEQRSITPDQLITTLKRMPEAKRAPILQKFVDKGTAVDGNGMMSWEQIGKLKDLGFDFGAHTVNHPLLCYENDETVVRELNLSKQTLEKKLGIPIHAFAYPSGNYDQRIEHLVRRSGFRFAFTCEPQWYQFKKDSFAIPRFLLHEGCVTNRGAFSPAVLELTLTGWRK
ncbi:MAG: polysaccharide deacetylase family protein [Acidobacteriaceae bacterium]